MYILQLFYKKYPLIFAIFYYIMVFIGLSLGFSVPPLSEFIGNIYLMDTTDDEGVSSKEESYKSSDQENNLKDKKDSSDYSVDKGETSTGYSVKNSIEKDPTPTFRVGTITPPSSEGQSVHSDLYKRLEMLMLNQTQSFMNQEDHEIQSKGLHTKAESELTSEEADLIRYRESNAAHMAETSAKLLKLESQSLTNPVNPSSSDLNPQKRDLESTDINPLDTNDKKKSR